MKASKVLASISVATLLIGMVLVEHGIGQDAEPQSAWQLVDIPQTWKKASGGPYTSREGQLWFRCLVDLPADWKGRKLEMFVEAVDDARQVYFNGTRIGALGSFPPAFRSGLGDSVRLAIDPKLIHFDKPNMVAIRVYHNYGRANFNVAAPVLFGGDQAIRLSGKWQARSGDNVAWAGHNQWNEALAVRYGDKLADADEVNRTLRKLDGDAGPQSPAEALAKIKVGEGLEVELAVTEPHVRQPLSLKFDERGRLWVIQYLQYPVPAGLKMISRDKYLRSVYDKVPPAPPNHFRGNDKITIHTDTDGDGTFDEHKTFVEGLSLATSIARGRGGVWVLNPPYLLFYPDRNNDDVPDGDPVVHLEGFGLEDSHSIANNLRWGPDGWLYGCQGSTVTGNVRRYGDKKTPPVFTMGQLIWRYHPETRRYEVFAEGGGNAFGLEMDSKGRTYSGHNGGDTRGFHYVQGGYLQKGFSKHGELSNPYAFGYFKPMQHHQAARFTHTFVINEGGALPAEYAGRLFGIAPLQSHVVQSDVSEDRSSFKTKDTGHVLISEDPWFRPVDIQVGPDGALYVADMYEQRIDHASHYQGRIHRESGRVYRVRAAGAERPGAINLGELSSPELIEHLGHPNKWHRQTALRLLADRRDRNAVQLLRASVMQQEGQLALEQLWALHLSGGFDQGMALRLLTHNDPYVRAWTVRLLGDPKQVSPRIATRFQQLAAEELNVHVRSQLASTARRLPAQHALPILDRLLRRTEDVDDIHIPLLLWWALEDKAESDREAVLQLFADPELWTQPTVQQHILERLIRRYAQEGSRTNLLTAARLLHQAPDAASGKRLMKGFEQAFQGRAMSGMPRELLEGLSKHGGGSLALRLQQSEPAAVEESLAKIQDAKTKTPQRIELVNIFGAIAKPQVVPVLLKLLAESKEDSLRIACLTSLQAYDLPEVGQRVVQLHDQLPADVQQVAQGMLASRSAWALELAQAVEAGKIDKQRIPLSLVRKLQLHDQPQLAELVSKHWGKVQGATTAEMRSELQRLVGVIGTASGNPYKGKELFAQHCGKCHVLFGQGGRIGPDLTSYKRDDLSRVLANVVNPSLEIREGYENFVVYTEDGRALTGFIADQDNRVVVLKSIDGATVSLTRDNIEEMKAVPQSIMPEKVLKPLSDQQIRDLFAYLRATQPLP